jgi:hypothetical protein
MAQLLSTTVTGTLNVSSTLNTATSISTPTINATTINATSYVNATGVNMATVAGANQQIIFNNNSVSGATPNLIFNVAQNVLTVGINTLVVNATSNNISTNTLLMLNSGSVAYPAIQMGATNRGFYQATGGSIGFISAGYEQARLGLITSTVNYLLLSGANTGNAATLTAIGSDANISLGLTSINNSSIIFTTNATEVARINASGLGIGTNTPAAALHVSISTGGQNIFVDGYGSSGGFIGRSAGNNQAFPTATPANQSMAFFGARGYTGSAFEGTSIGGMFVYSAEVHSTANQGSYLTFATITAGGISRTDKMAIDTQGNVGIGIIFPTSNLHVIGSANISGNTLSVGTTKSSTANGFSRITNGLLLQWGNVSVTNANTTVTFPSAFTTLYQVTVSTVLTGIAATGANVNCTPFITTSNVTTFNVRTNSATANVVNWMAIGN